MPRAAIVSAATRRDRSRRRSATTTPTEAVTSPPVVAEPAAQTGTATEQAPRVISSFVVAYPSVRIRSSCRASSPGAVIV